MIFSEHKMNGNSFVRLWTKALNRRKKDNIEKLSHKRNIYFCCGKQDVENSVLFSFMFTARTSIKETYDLKYKRLNRLSNSCLFYICREELFKRHPMLHPYLKRDIAIATGSAIEL